MFDQDDDIITKVLSKFLSLPIILWGVLMTFSQQKQIDASAIMRALSLLVPDLKWIGIALIIVGICYFIRVEILFIPIQFFAFLWWVSVGLMFLAGNLGTTANTVYGPIAGLQAWFLYYTLVNQRFKLQ